MKHSFRILVFATVVATSSFAQGVYWGTKGAPMPYFLGDVMKIVKKGPPIQMEETNIAVKLVRAYYRGNIIQGDLAKPIDGAVEEVFIGDTPIALKSKDISNGFLQTEKYGDIQILFPANLLRCYLLVTEEQLRSIKTPSETKTIPTAPKEVTVEKGKTEEKETVTVIKQSPTTEEKYELVSPSELTFGVEDFYYDGIVESGGMMKPTGGEIGKFTCEGRMLVLESNRFQDGFILTRDYDKIKIRFSSSLFGGTSFSIWLTPKQKTALMELKSRQSNKSDSLLSQPESSTTKSVPYTSSPQAAELEERLRQDPTQTKLYGDLGAIYMREKQFERAAQMFEQRFLRDPTAASAYINYALCNMTLKRWDIASGALRHALILRPAYIPGHLNLARCLTQFQGDSLRVAKTEYETVVQLVDTAVVRYRVELVEAYRGIAYVLLLEKKYSETLESLDKAIRLNDADAQAHLLKAQTLALTNKREEAVQEYQKVLQLDPANIQAKKDLEILSQR